MIEGAVASIRPASILIVDDERDNRELLQIILRHKGFRIRLAGSGLEAIESAAAQAPDLILLDLMMPDLDGVQVAIRLKANRATAGIAIIMFSASGDRSTRLRALAAGAEDLFVKPMDSAELCTRLATHFSARPPGR
jgi:DNA-binding response OmpR family regulator